jgi:hypothetical protein
LQIDESDMETTEDFHSLEGVIASLYRVISGDAGVKRDWNLLRSLFTENARMIPLALKTDGTKGSEARFLSVDEYVDVFSKRVETLGFFESEIARRTEQFGNFAHVFSTYEGKRLKTDAVPFVRGINSIQLINDGNRWWIMNIAWESERSDCPLPEKYLQSA